MTQPDRWSWLGPGGGEAAALVRRADWAATAVGPVEAWSASLKSIVATVLHARQPMFLWWGSELVQFYNDAYTPSFGVGRHPSAMGQRGRDCWGEIWPIIGPQIAGVRETGEAIFFDDALVPIYRNGRMEEVYWTYGYSPVFESDGTIAGVLVTVTETTSRVIALRRLRTAQQLGDALAVAMTLGDLQHAAVQSLSAAREDSPWVLAYETEHASGENALFHLSGIEETRARQIIFHVTQALAQHAPVGDLQLVDVSAVPELPGAPWPEPSTHAFALTVGGGRPSTHVVFGLSPRLPHDGAYAKHARGIAHQLTNALERISSQRARIAAEGARNNLLLQAPIAAALLVGPRWRYELANQLYVRMVGREVVGRGWHDCFPELCGTPVEEILAKVYRHGETFFASEQLVPLARESDGVVEDRFFDFNMIAIRSPSGAVEAMMVVAVEMTAQVRSRRELEQNVAEREELVLELKRAARDKDDFLAMLGHELRNPLSPIVTALSLMRRREVSGSQREQAVIERQVTHLIRLVDDLLDVSRITRGKIELRRTVSDPVSLVSHAVEIVEPLMKQREHTLEVEVEPGMSWHGDATRLEQVFANLLTNAARYTERGGRVRLTARHHHDVLVVSVRDNGRGIDRELMDRIFEPFVQGERGSDRREGGLGLGLAVVKGLVTLHGGTVEVHSDGPGHGSEFVVQVPGLVTQSVETALPRPTESVAQERKDPTEQPVRRILVVDDNEDAASLFAEILQLQGHEVAIANDGATALSVAESFAPQLAFLDIGLPIMDGYELIGRLRQQHGSRCRYFALTGYGQKEDAERTQAAGFERLLVKPVDLQVVDLILGSQ